MSPKGEAELMSQNEIIRVSGKWKLAGVPHKGWTCTDIEDLGEPNMTCEMCETTEIRYVHYMEHPNYPEILGCGCVCAGHLEENYDRAHAREKVLRNEAIRRKNWVKRKWRTSLKGNSFIISDGFAITVFQKGDYWSASIKDKAFDKVHYTKKPYSSENAAKLAAFDSMIFLKNKHSF